MYSADRQPPLPISEQFADVLRDDIRDYVENLQQLDRPEVSNLLTSARQQMQSDNQINQVSPEIEGLGSMVAVDGGNNILNVGAGTHCFVISVRYSLRENFDVRISMERLQFEHDEPSALMYGVRNALEVRDIFEINEQESFCIVDNSWVSLLQNVNRTLVHYRNASSADQEVLEPFLRPMLAREERNGQFIRALKHPRNIAISKGGVSRDYVNQYGDESIDLTDKIFLLGILREGEYTKPRALVESGQGQLNVHTSDLFAAQDDIKEFYNSSLNSTGSDCICSTYFKPHRWSPIKRIEFHRDLLRRNRVLFHQMLASVRDSMTIPTIQEPIEQFLVDEIVRRHTGRLPDIYQTASVANIRDFENDFAVRLVQRLRT